MEDMIGRGNGMQPIKPPPENNNNPHQPPPLQPLKQCPRCFSFNTRFCYYNNGCSSQPRYLCKSCRRHWTVGGTLRNIPIGGGCRKGSKRLIKGNPSSNASSSCSSYFRGECSRSEEQIPPPQPSLSPFPPPAPPLPPLLPPNIRGFSSMGLPLSNSLYSTGENLSSFAGMQNLNHPQGFNQTPLSGVGSVSGESLTNFSLLEGFTCNPNLITQQQVQPSIYQTLETEEMMAELRFPSSFWSQGLITNPSCSNITNVSWAENMLLQPSNNIVRSGSARLSTINSQNQRSNDVDEDDLLPGCDSPSHSS